MSKKKIEIRVGTSGWSYDDWRGRFYPEDIAKTKWLEYFCKEFDTVEINNTFYHLPKNKTVKNWRDTVGDNFLFTAKASRYITHVKKLNDPEDSIDKFFDVINSFEDKLGLVLYQLPPNLHINEEKLENFLEAIPRKENSVFEFRHDSWYEKSIFDLLEKYNCGFCIHDMTGNESPRRVTSELMYLRFHGASGKYQGNYPDKMIEKWAEWVKENSRGVKRVFAYFNNDLKGYAVKNAMSLRKFLKEKLNS